MLSEVNIDYDNLEWVKDFFLLSFTSIILNHSPDVDSSLAVGTGGCCTSWFFSFYNFSSLFPFSLLFSFLFLCSPSRLRSSKSRAFFSSSSLGNIYTFLLGKEYSRDYGSWSVGCLSSYIRLGKFWYETCAAIGASAEFSFLVVSGFLGLRSFEEYEPTTLYLTLSLGASAAMSKCPALSLFWCLSYAYLIGFQYHGPSYIGY